MAKNSLRTSPSCWRQICVVVSDSGTQRQRLVSPSYNGVFNHNIAPCSRMAFGRCNVAFFKEHDGPATTDKANRFSENEL